MQTIYSVVCTLVLPWALLTSCVSRAAKRTTSRSSAPQEIIPLPVETRIGVVRAIGADQRYVLIETASALATSALTEGQILHSRPADANNRPATTDLRVSRERHQTLVVANVVAGEPSLGAVVYSTTDTAPRATPSPDSISSAATAPLPGLFPPHPR